MSEKLHQVQAQAKLWAAQTRITVKAEVDLLLAKVDASVGQTARAEEALRKAQAQLAALRDSKAQLERQLEGMIPVSELSKTSDKAGKQLAQMDELDKRHQSALAELEAHKNALKVAAEHPLPRPRCPRLFSVTKTPVFGDENACFR